MANQLSMSKIHSIETLHRSGHSNREIARLPGLDRGTVNKYVLQLRQRSKPAKSEPAERIDLAAANEVGENRPNPRTGSEGESDVVKIGHCLLRLVGYLLGFLGVFCKRVAGFNPRNDTLSAAASLSRAM